MESKKLNEKDKNFHPKFQVHCLDVVSFPKIWRDDVFFFFPRWNLGCIFFSGVVVIDMRELSLAVCSFAFPLTSLCFLQRECCWHRFLPLPPLPYYSSLQRICQELGVLRLLQSRTSPSCWRPSSWKLAPRVVVVLLKLSVVLLLLKLLVVHLRQEKQSYEPEEVGFGWQLPMTRFLLAAGVHLGGRV